MTPAGSSQQSSYHPSARSIGRIASVTGSKAIVLLDTIPENDPRAKTDRPEMGMLLAIDTTHAIVLATVGALSVPVPAQGAENEIRIAELGLVGELTKDAEVGALVFNRGTTTYPALGDRVRLATKHELQLTYSGDGAETVRVGCIRQDTSIPAVVRIDDLLGKHFAVLGTTGTGKSCSTALILRAILEKNPNAHIMLLDPHNEYATAFGERAEIVSPRNMQLPLWLLNFEEAVEVLVPDSEHKAEIEILQDLIPLAKIRYAAGRSSEPQRLRKGSLDSGRYTVDTPVPYRISDLTHLIDERMGKLENRKDLAPYRQIKTRIETLSQDGRYAFMFGSVAVYDSMAQVLSRVFRVPVRGKPITIVELTGLPPEVVNVVVSVLCRMAFDFALWGEGQVPVTVVCEEAHRYVPLNPQMGFEPCKRAIAKIAKEGRKYGVSLCIVTQRPAEIDPTILSQCNTVFALRMSNDRDQAIVSSAIADTGTGLLEFLPALGHREAIAFGDGVPLPVRIKFDELPAHALPRSSTAKFSDKWQYSVGDEGFLDAVVERWRAAGIGGLDMTAQAHLLAEAVDIPMGGSVRRADAVSSDPGMSERTYGTEQAADAAMYGGGHEFSVSAAPLHEEDAVQAPRLPEIDLRRSPPPMPPPVRRAEPPQREATPPAQSAVAGSSITRSALRERLLKPSNTR
jgi:DNA helicase HerA-like ATPase